MNIAICIVGRILGYENNIDSIKQFINYLQLIGNVYIFVSLNTIKDEYHIEFENFINTLNNLNNNYFYYENIFYQKILVIVLICTICVQCFIIKINVLK